jgi:hypothetical protein
MTTTGHTYAEQRAAFYTGQAVKAPPDVIAALTAEQTDLDAAGVPGAILLPGTAMPDADLLDVHGTATTLEQARAGRAAVIVFYRGAWCPYAAGCPPTD